MQLNHLLLKLFCNEVISTLGIKRSLSMKGCPYDHDVAEAAFKIFRTEFVYGQNFDSLG